MVRRNDNAITKQVLQWAAEENGDPETPGKETWPIGMLTGASGAAGERGGASTRQG